MRHLAFALILCLSPSLRADPPRHNEAKELYQKATRHYELGEYDRAIEEYRRAYEISAAPALLFNLGQVYRLKKDPATALRFYENYLRLVPAADNRADVEGFIVEMRAAVEAEKQAAAARAQAGAEHAQNPAPPPAAIVAPATTIATPVKRRPWKLEAWTAGGLVILGVGATGAGIGVGVRANGDANRLLADAATRTNVWTPARQATYRDGQNSAAAATALDVIGPVVVAAGVVVGVLALHDRKVARRFAVDGRGVAWAF
jgi:tetratricopeptide (TPR) repeat protein